MSRCRSKSARAARARLAAADRRDAIVGGGMAERLVRAVGPQWQQKAEVQRGEDEADWEGLVARCKGNAAEKLCHPFFFSSRRRHTSSYGDWSSDVCSSD